MPKFNKNSEYIALSHRKKSGIYVAITVEEGIALLSLITCPIGKSPIYKSDKSQEKEGK
jgi:hypothetical protein